MVELQILNKVLKDKSDDIVLLNDITDDYFIDYPEEWKFITSHKADYGNIPDVETFLAKFPDFDILVVNESDDYLISTIREEHLFAQSVPVLEKMSELLQTDSYAAVDYLKTSLPNLNISGVSKGVDIISQAKDRFEEYQNVRNNSDDYFIPTGFEQLDDIIGGWHKGEELVVIFARTGQGKTWVVEAMATHAWKMNQRVAFVEPEMTATKTGYRFDTLNKHFSNSSLLRGVDAVGYEHYINDLSTNSIPFFVLHPKDFNRKVTVTKLKSYCESNNIDVLVIDGISYMTDERKERGDNKTTQLTHISEDLMDLSIDLGIPVLIVCQSNREGAKEEDLQLENIRDSDGIAYNASIVISVMQKDPGLVLALTKSRNSAYGTKLTYLWDIDTGMFSYIPSGNDDMYDDEEEAENLRNSYQDTQEEY